MLKFLPKWLKVVVALILLIYLSLILTNINQEETRPPYQFFTGSENKHRPQEVTENLKVKEIFKNEIPALEGRWGIYIKDLKTGKAYVHGETEVIPSASIYKLTVLWAVYDAIEKKQMSFDDPIAGTNVKEALRLMITISDNDTAIALAETIGWSQIHRLMESQGIVGFDLIRENGPFTTASATANLLERIYRKTAVSQKASGQMQQLLFDQQKNDRIPKYLPKSAKVAHKTGEIDSVRHDAGIIIGKKSHYIFVFLSETNSPENESETIAALSKRIYDELEAQ